MGQTVQTIKINFMDYDEIIDEIKKILKKSGYKYINEFNHIMQNFLRMSESGSKLPLDSLKQILEKKISNENFDILTEIKKEYLKFFTKKNKNGVCVNKYKYYINKIFVDKFKIIQDYDELIKEHDYYYKYRNFANKIKNLYKLSNESLLVLFEYIKLKDNKNDLRDFLKQSLIENFSFSFDEIINFTTEELDNNGMIYGLKMSIKNMMKNTQKKHIMKMIMIMIIIIIILMITIMIILILMIVIITVIINIIIIKQVVQIVIEKQIIQ